MLTYRQTDVLSEEPDIKIPTDSSTMCWHRYCLITSSVMSLLLFNKKRFTLEIHPWCLGFRFKCASYLLHSATKSRRPEATVGAFRRGKITRNSLGSIARNFNAVMESIGRAIRPKFQSLRVYVKPYSPPMHTASKNQFTEISIIYKINPKVGQFFDDRVHRRQHRHYAA